MVITQMKKWWQGLKGSEKGQEVKGGNRVKGKEKENVVLKMEGVWTRARYTKDGVKERERERERR
jgi:hypothetical protein